MIHIIIQVIQNIRTIIGLRNRMVLIEALFYSYLLIKEVLRFNESQNKSLESDLI
jgi:hypothetical protein